MKQTQRTSNPFVNSDSNKRYYTYEYYLRRTFGGKCAKIPLDAGFTCPNIDGKCGHGGCIYCSGRGSGDFALPPSVPLDEQYRKTRVALSKKWDTSRCIPYFQAHTNTYAPLSVLREKFEPVLYYDGVVGMNIATRADCIDTKIAEYLAELSQRTVLTVELGLQTVHDDTAKIINRGHSFDDFLHGYELLRRASDKINICVHLIFGLPDENSEKMLQSVRETAKLKPEQVKIHLLHVLQGTLLSQLYLDGKYIPMERKDYIETVVSALELLPPDTVIARLTGDGIPQSLLAPDWSRKKVSVINDIDKLLYVKNTFQGRFFEDNSNNV